MAMAPELPDLQSIKFSKDSVSALAVVHRFLPEDVREPAEYFIFFGDDADKKRYPTGERVFTWDKRATSTVWTCLEHSFVWNDRILLLIIDRDFDMSFCAALLSAYEIGGKTVRVPLSDRVLFSMGEKAASFRFLDEMDDIEKPRFKSVRCETFLQDMMFVLHSLGNANFVRTCCDANHLFEFADTCIDAHCEARKRLMRAEPEIDWFCDSTESRFDKILSDEDVDTRLKLRIAERALENELCSPKIVFTSEFDELGERRTVFLEGLVHRLNSGETGPSGQTAIQRGDMWRLPSILAGNKARIGADLFAGALDASLRASFTEAVEEDAGRNDNRFSFCPGSVRECIKRVKFDASDIETFAASFRGLPHSTSIVHAMTGLILDAVLKYSNYDFEGASPRIFFDNVTALAERFGVGIPGDEEISSHLETSAASKEPVSEDKIFEAKSTLAVFLALGADHIDPDEWKRVLEEHPSEFEGAVVSALDNGWFGRREKLFEILSAMGRAENVPAEIPYPRPPAPAMERIMFELRSTLAENDGVPEEIPAILAGPLSRWIVSLAAYPPSTDEEKRAIRNAFEEVSGIVVARMAKMAEEEMADGVVL